MGGRWVAASCDTPLRGPTEPEDSRPKSEVIGHDAGRDTKPLQTFCKPITKSLRQGHISPPPPCSGWSPAFVGTTVLWDAIDSMPSKPQRDIWGAGLAPKRAHPQLQTHAKASAFQSFMAMVTFPPSIPSPGAICLPPLPALIFLANDGERCLFTCGLVAAAGRHLFGSCCTPQEVSWPARQDAAGPWGWLTEHPPSHLKSGLGLCFLLNASS